MLSMRCPHLPTTHPSENANLIPVIHRLRGQFGGRTRPLHDGDVGSTCWNFCVASNLYWAVRVHGVQLVLPTQN